MSETPAPSTWCDPHLGGRADPPQARLRAGALPRDGRVPELRDQLHDHLDPRRLPDVVLPRVPVGRPGRGHVGLADRRPLHDVRRALDGRDRLDLPDGRRPLLLVVEARQPGVGLVHRLVQPDRPDRHRRRASDTASRSSPRRSSTCCSDYPNDRAAHLLRLRRRHARRGAAQHVRRPYHVAAERDLGVLARRSASSSSSSR